jgi:hypothetical protein
MEGGREGGRERRERELAHLWVHDPPMHQGNVQQIEHGHLQRRNMQRNNALPPRFTCPGSVSQNVACCRMRVVARRAIHVACTKLHVPSCMLHML